MKNRELYGLLEMYGLDFINDSKAIEKLSKLDSDIVKLLLEKRRSKQLLEYILENMGCLLKKDIILILTARNKEITECLMDVATDINSLNSPYHAKDMELIANAKSDEIARYLRYAATDVDSLKSEYHAKDMELIANAKSDEIARYLMYAATDVDSLNSNMHEIIMEFIAKKEHLDFGLLEFLINAGISNIAKYLYEVATDKDPLSSASHEGDMILIVNPSNSEDHNEKFRYDAKQLLSMKKELKNYMDEEVNPNFLDVIWKKIKKK